jgi:hypothetical protein
MTDYPLRAALETIDDARKLLEFQIAAAVVPLIYAFQHEIGLAVKRVEVHTVDATTSSDAWPRRAVGKITIDLDMRRLQG